MKIRISIEVKSALSDTQKNAFDMRRFTRYAWIDPFDMGRIHSICGNRPIWYETIQPICEKVPKLIWGNSPDMRKWSHLIWDNSPDIRNWPVFCHFFGKKGILVEINPFDLRGVHLSTAKIVIRCLRRLLPRTGHLFHMSNNRLFSEVLEWSKCIWYEKGSNSGKKTHLIQAELIWYKRYSFHTKSVHLKRGKSIWYAKDPFEHIWKNPA